MDYASMAFGIMDGVVTGGKYIFLLALFGFIMWLAVFYMQYNIPFRVKEITGGRKVIYDTKAKYDKKNSRLKVWKFRDTAPLPPSKAYNTNPRGKKCLEAYRINGQYVYGIDDMTEDGMKFEALTSGDREFYINELRIAEERKGFDWQQNIPAIAGLTFIMIMLVVTFLFWGDIMKPAVQAQATSAQILGDVKIVTQNQAAIMQDLREIIKKEQVIRDAAAINIPTNFSVPPG